MLSAKIGEQRKQVTARYTSVNAIKNKSRRFGPGREGYWAEYWPDTKELVAGGVYNVA